MKIKSDEEAKKKRKRGSTGKVALCSPGGVLNPMGLLIV
jgi:hypothetical protein